LGFVAGMVTVLYRYLLEQASSVSEQVLTLARESVLLVLAWLAFLGFLGWVVGYLVRFEPLAAGSGIPHVKGVLSGKLQAVWWRILLVCEVRGWHPWYLRWSFSGERGTLGADRRHDREGVG
jgi:H+/Cl- antiporter ClcA